MTYKRAELVWLCKVRGEGKSFQDQRTGVFVSHFSNDNEEFQRNWKKYYIDNDYMWNTDVYAGKGAIYQKQSVFI